MGKTRDFGGWATRFNIKCADGRTIKPGAFDDCDGKTVPLVWNHMHDSPLNVLGHAVLHCKDEGVYADCYLNETTQGQNVKTALKNGDFNSLSIYANQLKHVNGSDVVHGTIRELSLVLAGANPGAFIDTAIAHSEDGVDPEEAVIYSGDVVDDCEDKEEIAHSEDDVEKETKDMSANNNAENEALEHSDDKKKKDVEDIIETMNEDQKKVLYYLVDEALKQGDKSDSDKGEEDMKHNVFDNESAGATMAHSLTRDEQFEIIKGMKQAGSLRESFLAHKEEMGIEDVIMHTDDHGIEYSDDVQAYMVNDPSFLFPEARALNNPPAWIKRDTTWVSGVLNGTKHVPFSRIKSVFADITEDEARAKGYMKTHKKTEEVFSLLKRTTTPQTIYKKQKMDRDDIIDITDFDVVAWIRGEMRIMLDEEIARAILVGDGRLNSSDDKISEDHIRPVWTDDDLFTIKQFVTYPEEATDDDKAKAYIRAAVKARKNYKGSGNPTFYTTEDVLTDMLLLEDNMGHRLYKSEQELATAMRVSKIVTVQVMEGLQREVDNVERDLIGIIVNLSDYTVGADKGGAISMFDDFDIDYNQQKYLIETRCSGALTVPYSAIVIESAQQSA
jgi:HK97 family phage prohead protease/HK97 family phage major capsid protein